MGTKRIDWNKVRKVCKKLGIFKGFFDPCEIPFEMASWQIFLSVRGNGKTTSMLLLGMVLEQMYGIRIEYCRLMPDDIKPMKHRTLFDSIKALGYIEKITNGRYNDCVYKAGFWRYVLRDSNGEIMDEATEPFMHVFSVKQAMNMKSSYITSQTKYDDCFIVYDEFIDPTKLYQDDFVLLCDCISTIARLKNATICMLANTIDRQSVWFRELNIAREILDLKLGESKLIQKDGCSPVYVHLLATKQTEKRQSIVNKIFSFKNPKLSAITGSDDGWSMRMYPRLPRAKRDYIMRNIYLDAHGFTVRIDIINHEEIGLCCNVVDTDYRSDNLPDDAILFTLEPIVKENQFWLHTIKLGMLIKWFYDNGRMYYGTNQAGNTWDSYINSSFN